MRNFLLSIGAAAMAAAFVASPALADPAGAGGSLVSVNPSSGVDHDTLPNLRMPNAMHATTAPGPMRSAALSQSHIQWCETHYKSYRVSDDTFQPYQGPRKLCISPANG